MQRVACTANLRLYFFNDLRNPSLLLLMVIRADLSQLSYSMETYFKELYWVSSVRVAHLGGLFHLRFGATPPPTEHRKFEVAQLALGRLFHRLR